MAADRPTTLAALRSVPTVVTTTVRLAVFAALVGCGGGGGGGADKTVSPPAISAVTVSPGSVALQGVGATTTASATITPSNATGTISWASTTPSVATVSGSGTSATITAVGAGTATVTATAGGISGITTVTVTPIVRAITPSRTAVAVVVGGTTTLTAALTADPGASTALTWTSSSNSIATVDGSGVLTGVAPGSATITVASTAFPAINATISVTVAYPLVRSVTITPANPGVVTGFTRQLAAAVDVDAGTSTSVTWSSSATAIATVTASGLVSAVAPGSATIRATSTANPTVSGTTTVTVTVPPVSTVVVTLAMPSIVLGTDGNQALVVLKDASGTVLQERVVSFQSSNTTVATVNASGVITTVGVGTSTITATSEGQSGGALLTVTPAASPVVYWSYFDSRVTTPQISFANAPLTGGSTVTNVPWSSTLRQTAGMTVDATGRLWVISYPQAGGIVAAVFTLPLTAASTPALLFTLPSVIDIDFITFDGAGNLWASDYSNKVEYMFAGPFTVSRTLAPSVTLALPGFSNPGGIAIDGVGNVYVSNLGSLGTNSIAVFRAPITSASVPAFFLNGLSAPGGLVFDAQGNLYASNHPNGGQKTIVRYNSNNLVSGALPNIVNATGLGTQSYAATLAFDLAGNLFVADCGTTAGIRSYPTATSAFSATLAPSATYANSTITSVGCVWGIAIR